MPIRSRTNQGHIRSKPELEPLPPGRRVGWRRGLWVALWRLRSASQSVRWRAAFAGKSVGEMIDPTTDDDWLRKHFKSRPYVEKGDEYERFRSAYRYGALIESRHGDAGLDLTDEKVRQEWEAAEENDMPWSRACEAVKDGYDRTVQIRKERGCGTDESSGSGESCG